MFDFKAPTDFFHQQMNSGKANVQRLEPGIYSFKKTILRIYETTFSDNTLDPFKTPTFENKSLHEARVETELSDGSNLILENCRPL